MTSKSNAAWASHSRKPACRYLSVLRVSSLSPSQCKGSNLTPSFLYCLFAISNRVENKIRTNTTAETKKGQGNLFVSMRKRLESKPSTISSPKMPVAPSFDEGTSTSAIVSQEATTNADTVSPYAEAITQSDDTCWAGICAIFGAKNETQQQEAAASPRGVEDIVLSICGAHHKLGQVHDAVISGCCDPALARRELKHIHSSLSKITDK